jgi:hypothetical protein
MPLCTYISKPKKFVPLDEPLYVSRRWWPYPTAPSFVWFLSLDAPPDPAPSLDTLLATSVCLGLVRYASVTSTGPIFKHPEFVNLDVLMTGRDWRPHRSIIMHRNDTHSNPKQLLDVSNTWCIHIDGACLINEVEIRWLLAVYLLMCHLIKYVLSTSIN